MGAFAPDMLIEFTNQRWTFPTCVAIAVSCLCASMAQAQDKWNNDLEEVIVTAQKRNEKLQEVPVPVTALTADLLVNSNQLQLQDYYMRVPGLNLTTGDVHGAPMISIRGVTTGGFSNPTVGITVDDVPTGSSTNLGGGYEAPDLDPSELARVEVLRGPQGTLYGASSIGGLLKFVTMDPTTDQMSGRVQASVSSIRNGDGPSYGLRGSVNLPVGDTLAVRVSGFSRDDAGYIDDPGLGLKGVNQTDAEGGRMSALWQASENVSLKVSALLQNTEAAGSSDVERLDGLSDLEQSAVRGTGFFNRKNQAYSATLNVDAGSAEITSLSGYNITKISDSYDYSATFGGLADLLIGAPGTPYLGHYETKKFSQELRLSMPLGSRVDWLVGAFYTDEDSETGATLLAAVPATGAVVGTLFASDIPTTYEEYALFTDFTFKITDRFDIQVGGRQSENRQSYSEIDTGPLVGGLAINPEVRTKDDSFTYLLTPRFKVSPELMVYARLASGYRAGGPNPNSRFNLPPSFEPDKTQNYEIGVKGEAWDRRLTFDASVYYIDWKDIQLQLTTGGFLFYSNASRAKSQGVELSIDSEPIDDLRISGWVAWNEAELTDPFPVTSAASGAEGDRLPGSSRMSGSLSLDREFSLPVNMVGFVGASVSYIGDRMGVFTPSDRQNYPSYAKTDLRAGVNYDTWALNLFVNNLTDRRGELSGGLGTLNPSAFKYIQPRTIGMSLVKTF